MTANFVAANFSKPKVRVDGWKKLRRDYVKLNVDASFDQDSLEGSVGAIIRHHNGKFIAVANEKIDICYDASSAEAIAVRFNLNLTQTDASAIAVRFNLNLTQTDGCSIVEVNYHNVEMILALKEGYSF
ncbi:putative protease Do-like 14 [Hordeum vulgare]|nr:putative protease Do-like 14 [Hordeum vulgare]